MAEEEGPPPAFTRPFVPPPVLAGARALRRWHALGPRLGRYEPVSTLEAPVNAPSAACVPAINFHTHLGRWLTQKAAWMEPDLGRLLDLMGSHNISALVNLDGRWGRELEDNLDRYDRAYPGRFYTFCHVDWRLLEKPRGPELLAESLGRSVAAGARGLKVWKDLGMQVTVRGRTILPDDDMLGPLWEAAGELGVPVLIHVGDPVAFFQPVDRQNERLEELLRHPGGSRAHTGPDELRGLLSSVEHLVASHPKTTVVAAHGFHPEDLAHVSAMMDRYENFFIDIAWAHLQLGRQPRAARDLITKHPGRVLFGTDVFPLRTGIFPIYFRFLETVDESFSYTDEPVPGSGRWPIYGLGLDHATLEQVYRANACKLLGLPPPH